MANENMTLDGSLLEVFLELKRIIMKQLHVGTLALVKDVNSSTKTLKVQPFPLDNNEESKLIDCFYLKDYDEGEEPFQVGGIVCILFLDKNFVNNLKTIQNGNNTIQTVNEERYHSEDYAIAIDTL